MKNISRVCVVLTVILLFLTSVVPSVMAHETGTPSSSILNTFPLLRRVSLLFYNKILPFPSIPIALGECPLLLLLVEFSDVPHHPDHDIAYFDHLLFGDKPSVRDYYQETSYGKFTFTKAGILGWYTSHHPLKEFSRDGIVREAFRKAARDRSFSFASYDDNGDGILTDDELAILVCTSALSEEKPRGAYHNWRLWGTLGVKTWDGMILSGEHSVLQEWQSWMVFAHELGHTLQLPDFYDYTRKSQGLGVYSLMGNGNLDGINGHHFTAWEKIQLGWIEPTVVTEDGWYVIHDSETCPEAFILQDPSHSSDEYFLVENRFRGTSYDNGTSPLPDEGIAIYHIDESIPRPLRPRTWFPGVNDVEYHKMIDIECADSFSSHFKDADDLDANKNQGDEFDFWDNSTYGFHSNSFPCNSRWYDGSENNIGVYVYSAPSRNMTVYFSVNGTAPGEV